MQKLKLISVDFQREYAISGGKHYRPRPCVHFIKVTLIPYLRKNNFKIAEIISDYRQPRPGDPYDDVAHPGEPGYISEIPEDMKMENIWIKCMNSPIWVRRNIGNPNRKPGIPYQNPEAFTKWLNSTIGKPEDAENVILTGLTLDCCIFCTAQELTWRGYKVKILKEAVDTYSGDSKEKEMILNNPPLRYWASIISWKEIKSLASP